MDQKRKNFNSFGINFNFNFLKFKNRKLNIFNSLGTKDKLFNSLKLKNEL